jgi:hypothetical protein
MNNITLELDAYDIAYQVFSDDSLLDNNFSFENVDLLTLFEMLMIILTEGLKKFFGNDHNIVNLNKNEIYKLNNYMKKINIRFNLQINEYNSNIKSYNQIDINNETQLRELNYIVRREKLYNINFDYLQTK